MERNRNDRGASLFAETFAGIAAASLPMVEQRPPMISNRLLLTVEEAGQLLGVGRTTVYQLIGDGEIRTVKIGRSRRVARCDLEAFVEQLRADVATAR